MVHFAFDTSTNQNISDSILIIFRDTRRKTHFFNFLAFIVLLNLILIGILCFLCSDDSLNWFPITLVLNHLVSFKSYLLSFLKSTLNTGLQYLKHYLYSYVCKAFTKIKVITQAKYCTLELYWALNRVRVSRPVRVRVRLRLTQFPGLGIGLGIGLGLGLGFPGLSRTTLKTITNLEGFLDCCSLLERAHTHTHTQAHSASPPTCVPFVAHDPDFWRLWWWDLWGKTDESAHRLMKIITQHKRKPKISSWTSGRETNTHNKHSHAQ